MQFPIIIYRNKKKLRNMLLLYVGLLVGCIVGFWIASGHLFTADEFYPKATIFTALGVPLCIVMIFVYIKELNSNESIMILKDEDIQYNRGIYKQIPNIPWSDLVSVNETMLGNTKFIRILVGQPEKYITQLSNSRDKEKFRKQVSKNDGFLSIMIEEDVIGYDLIEFEAIIKKKIENQLLTNIL